ncbi:MAG TPA: orotidine-5'-phosphate decarboxylase [Candidatus Saccharimonadales bacterium]|nr:orotidine-5'-phosphate decarboxylase [Candidatus Saccharimonadales bacterium]
MTFAQKLNATIEKKNSLLCVGLDSDVEKIPDRFKKGDKLPIFEFNKYIVDQTKDFVCSYKLNSAFYEAHGHKGLIDLQSSIEYIHMHDIPVILDAKRADIGNTNLGYVQFAYDYLNADAITLHPYLGKEALRPFLDLKDKGNVILCKTSNPGSGELQDVDVTGEPLYAYLAKKIVNEWNTNDNCMMVIGATYPEELKKIREVAPDMFFLVPGIGAQGGDLEKTLLNGLRADKSGLLIASSRGIIFSENPKEEAQKLRDEINRYR